MSTKDRRVQRAVLLPSGQWGCPHCAHSIQPPLFAATCVTDDGPPYWQIHYHCPCGTRYALATTVDLDHIDPDRTATMPIRSGIPPSTDPVPTPDSTQEESAASEGL